MKKRMLWRTMKGPKEMYYESVLGYPVDEGIFAIYELEDGEWRLHHVPTGCCVGMVAETYREGVEWCRRILTVNPVDWTCTDYKELGISPDVSNLLRQVAVGKVTPEAFNTKLMIEQIRRR